MKVTRNGSLVGKSGGFEDLPSVEKGVCKTMDCDQRRSNPSVRNKTLMINKGMYYPHYLKIITFTAIDWTTVVGPQGVIHLTLQEPRPNCWTLIITSARASVSGPTVRTYARTYLSTDRRVRDLDAYLDATVVLSSSIFSILPLLSTLRKSTDIKHRGRSQGTNSE